MALDKRKLYKISSNMTGMKIWGYDAQADTAATVNTTGYFNDAAKDLGVFDAIRCITSSGTVLTNFVVLSNDGTTVDVDDGTTVALTDGD